MARLKQEKLGKLCKERMTKELEKHFEEYPNFVITSYMGTPVIELEQLRKNLKRSSSRFLIVKNSILKVVFDRLKLNDFSNVVDGGIGISFAGGDVISVSKALVSFAKGHANFKIRSGILEGREIEAGRIEMLAAIPSKDYLVARALSGVKSPITGFVNTLGGVLRKFVLCLDAIKASRPR